MTKAPIVGIEILGGLGNQMFQYAAVLALSRRFGAEICCDTYRQIDDPNRPLGLSLFGATWREVQGPRRRGALRSIARFLRIDPKNPFERVAYFKEHEGQYDPEFGRLAGSCFLNGFFQSWRYFEGHADAIRETFDVSKLPVGGSAAMEARIRTAANPVAVHVRRGDYSDTPENVSRWGPLGPDYYRRAKIEIEKAGPRPTFFLFSDEPEKAAAELADWPDLVPVTGMTAHEDFRLMAMCRHFIIANSTFSWWAAWLGKTPDKVVVGPTNWFGPAFPYQMVTADLMPPDWKLIPNGR